MHTYNYRDMAARYGWDTTTIDTVLDKLDFLQKYGVFLAGGAIRRAILKMPVLGEADFDFFFKTKTGFEMCCQEMEDLGAKKVRETEQNITFTLTITFDEKDVETTIQFIRASYYHDAEAVLNSFDFTLCQFVLDFDRVNLYCGDTSLYDVSSKRIIVNRIDFPVASMRRIIKYTKQGFYACPGSMLTFLEHVQGIQGELMRGQPSSLD